MVLSMSICNLFGENQVRGEFIAEQVRETGARPNTHLGLTSSSHGFVRIRLTISVTIKHTYKPYSRYSSNLLIVYDYIAQTLQHAYAAATVSYAFCYHSQILPN